MPLGSAKGLSFLDGGSTNLWTEEVLPSVRGAVETEPDDEDPLVDRELDGVCPPPVPPLVAPVVRRGEPAARLPWQSLARARSEPADRGLLLGSEVKEQVGGLLQGQHTRSGHCVRKLLDRHGREADQVECCVQHLTALARLFSLANLCEIGVSSAKSKSVQLGLFDMREQ